MATPEFIPDNPNLFQLEALSGNPNLSAISVRCPHCRELGSFGVVGNAAITFQKSGSHGPNRVELQYFASIRVCPNDNLPPRCQETLKEAIACHGAQELDAQTAKDWGAVNEIVPADKLLARAREVAEGLAKLPSLTTKYTRIAMTQKLRRIIDEGVTLGLALEGISAADVARVTPK